jgi:mannitol/fructose-specific phosphotransferase system IIA component
LTYGCDLAARQRLNIAVGSANINLPKADYIAGMVDRDNLSKTLSGNFIAKCEAGNQYATLIKATTSPDKVAALVI